MQQARISIASIMMYIVSSLSLSVKLLKLLIIYFILNYYFDNANIQKTFLVIKYFIYYFVLFVYY